VALGVRDLYLFDAISDYDVRLAQIVTGVTMAAFIGVGLTPGLRQHAAAIRGALLALYLLVCGVLVSHALVR
jgi:hypothetical protein